MHSLSYHALAGLLMFVIGCGAPDGPELGTVSGVITLDDKPLQMATIEFSPVAPGGSSSSGRTDATGRYELMYLAGKPGAITGQYVVRITTWRQEHVPGAAPRVIAELVPPIYNSESKLFRDVISGSSTLDFELSSSADEPVENELSDSE
ncbi:MAG: carboxypeptidase regulatory-like domain-containing protein [Planctomycetota bacterium]|nr:carboxypeptidase regulatory-like domain-containing protein [Planctomycetota bacterium]MDA1166078.1 carboxypeptidase regulatory-like domain-containing protein [Planctomycetota bacterium]